MSPVSHTASRSRCTSPELLASVALTLILWSTSHAVTGVALHDAASVAASTFRYNLVAPIDDTVRDASIVSRCVATRVSTSWLITASHCLSESDAQWHIECPLQSGEQGATPHEIVVSAANDVHAHPSYDIALVRLDNLPGCIGAPVPMAGSLAESVSWLVLPLAGDAQPASTIAHGTTAPATLPGPAALEELKRQHGVVILEDRAACLAQGDSGYPLFITGTDGTLEMAGLLIGGTQGCPSIQRALQLDVLLPWVREHAW